MDLNKKNACALRTIMVVCLCLIGGTAGAQILSLSDCIGRGIDENLSLCNARIDMERGQLAVRQARARHLPVVNGVAQVTAYILNPVNVTTGTLLGNDFSDDPTWQTIKSMPNNANAGILGSVSLYDRTVNTAIEAAKTIEELKSMSYDKAREELVMQVSRAYYLAQTTKAQVQLLDDVRERMDSLCDIAKAQYENGVAMEVDWSRARINLRSVTAQRDQCLTLHQQQLNLLRFLINLPDSTNFEVQDLPDEFTRKTIGGLDMQRPDIRLALSQGKLSEKRLNAVKSAYLPTIAISGYIGGVSYQDRFDRFFHGREARSNWFGNSYIALSVKVPIYDGRRKRMQINQYRYEMAQAANNVALLTQKNGEEYANAQLQMAYNLDNLDVQSENCRLAEDVYSLAEMQYCEGVTSMSVLLQDEMRLRTARLSRASAMGQCLISQLELLRLSGEIDLLNN